MNSRKERSEPIKNVFVGLVTFGDHTLHHLFSSLDHSLMPLLQDVFEDTCKKHDMDMSPKPVLSIIRGQFQQLVRITPKKYLTNVPKD